MFDDDKISSFKHAVDRVERNSIEPEASANASSLGLNLLADDAATRQAGQRIRPMAWR